MACEVVAGDQVRHLLVRSVAGQRGTDCLLPSHAQSCDCHGLPLPCCLKLQSKLLLHTLYLGHSSCQSWLDTLLLCKPVGSAKFNHMMCQPPDTIAPPLLPGSQTSPLTSSSPSPSVMTRPFNGASPAACVFFCPCSLPAHKPTCRGRLSNASRATDRPPASTD